MHPDSPKVSDKEFDSDDDPVVLSLGYVNNLVSRTINIPDADSHNSDSNHEDQKVENLPIQETSSFNEQEEVQVEDKAEEVKEDHTSEPEPEKQIEDIPDDNKPEDTQSDHQQEEQKEVETEEVLNEEINVEPVVDVVIVDQTLEESKTSKSEPAITIPSPPYSEDSQDAVTYILYLIAMQFNKVVFNESEFSYESEESEQEDASPAPKQTHRSPQSAPHKNKRDSFLRRQIADPKTILRNFGENDDENIRELKIDILHQSESLSLKLAERRKKRGQYAKRASILTPGGKSPSFFHKDMEDTLATDTINNMGPGKPHSFNVEDNGEDNFKEIFNALEELETDSLMMNMNRKVDSIPQDSSPSNDRREEYDQKKEEFLGRLFN